MDQPARLGSATRQLFHHHLYEYRKGVRQLFMMTMTMVESENIIEELSTSSIDYHVHAVTENKVNVFFGRHVLVEVMKTVVTKPLSRLSPEEDFILGTLLGYDKEQQCRRFLARIRK